MPWETSQLTIEGIDGELYKEHDSVVFGTYVAWRPLVWALHVRPNVVWSPGYACHTFINRHSNHPHAGDNDIRVFHGMPSRNSYGCTWDTIPQSRWTKTDEHLVSLFLLWEVTMRRS